MEYDFTLVRLVREAVEVAEGGRPRFSFLALIRIERRRANPN